MACVKDLNSNNGSTRQCRTHSNANNNNPNNNTDDANDIVVSGGSYRRNDQRMRSTQSGTQSSK